MPEAGNPTDKATQTAYEKLAASHRPTAPAWGNLWRAFVIGGLICTAGQAVISFFEAHGYTPTTAAPPTVVVMIGLGSLFTGMGWYDALVTWGGMGGSLPITGFANSIVAPAMEYKREGPVMGVGAKMFTVAGPVIAYGLAAAFVVGAVRWFLGLAA
jgi:stage V sporulation protein AC